MFKNKGLSHEKFYYSLQRAKGFNKVDAYKNHKMVRLVNEIHPAHNRDREIIKNWKRKISDRSNILIKVQMVYKDFTSLRKRCVKAKFK